MGASFLIANVRKKYSFPGVYAMGEQPSVNSFLWFILFLWLFWFVWFIWFLWFNKPNNETNKTDQTNRLRPHASRFTVHVLRLPAISHTPYAISDKLLQLPRVISPGEKRILRCYQRPDTIIRPSTGHRP